MPVNWNAERIRDYAELHANEEQRYITEALIWRTVSIGINEITERNAEEFAVRCHMYQEVYSGMDITYADIHRRIGLRTNAASITTAAFNKGMITAMRDTAARNIASQATALSESGVTA